MQLASFHGFELENITLMRHHFHSNLSYSAHCFEFVKRVDSWQINCAAIENSLLNSFTKNLKGWWPPNFYTIDKIWNQTCKNVPPFSNIKANFKILYENPLVLSWFWILIKMLQLFLSLLFYSTSHTKFKTPKLPFEIHRN